MISVAAPREPTQALDRIWQRVRRLNRYVEERAPWELARDPANAEKLEARSRLASDKDHPKFMCALALALSDAK